MTEPGRAKFGVHVKSDILKIGEAAEYLRISERTLRRWLADPETRSRLRPALVGPGKGTLRFTRESLAEYVAGGECRDALRRMPGPAPARLVPSGRGHRPNTSKLKYLKHTHQLVAVQNRQQ